MKQSEVFASALWVGAGTYAGQAARTPDPSGLPLFPILRSTFRLSGIRSARLRVLGLGFFHAYLNGKPVSDDEFLPLSTNYEAGKNDPKNEVQTGCRIYVPEYEVTDLLREGQNVLAIHFGGGWYTHDGGDWCPDHPPYGCPKAIFRLTVETDRGTAEIVSSECDRIGDSYVKTYDFITHENQDFTGFDDRCLGPDFDDSRWPHARAAAPVISDYLFTSCPADGLEPLLPVTELHRDGDTVSYDTGRNCACLPVLTLTGKPGETVTVLCSEERNPDGTLDMAFHHRQHMTFVCDGTRRQVRPMFTWFAFRYLQVIGPAVPEGVLPVHSRVDVTADFSCDNETLNWLYHAYLNTQLSNLHAGIPSDCPHLERRGYTGDGQLTCHAVMDTLDAKAFYRKWIDDIADCQDVYTGHIQYTAPYLNSGGGPGGWGCAIVEVPYQYYKHYGDAEPLHRLYGQMLRYFDYLEAHSQLELVTSDQPGVWCLGDWCAPHNYNIVLPGPFVNTYFYVKSLMRMLKIAPLVGRQCDVPMLEARLARKKDAIHAAYYNSWDGNYMGCVQGANAFALDIGLWDQKVYDSLVKYYTELGCFDTGIFGTDIVTRVLFAHGDGELAVRLLTSEKPWSFAEMRRAGATTLWENWPHADWDRSRNHPMFGAVVAYLFDFLLGIPVDAGDTVTLTPVIVPQLHQVSGSRRLSCGKVSVSYRTDGETVDFEITLPDGVSGQLKLAGKTYKLHPGQNTLSDLPVKA